MLNVARRAYANIGFDEQIQGGHAQLGDLGGVVTA
jgi:hypothetical protein